jgi:hypothetical protein
MLTAKETDRFEEQPADHLPQFVREDEVAEGEEGEEMVKRKKRHPRRPTIEPGPEAVKNPEWARVNDQAKAQWLVAVGMVGKNAPPDPDAGKVGP